MAAFESIKPTSLLKQIRGKEGVYDPKANAALNFASFLRPHIERLVEDLRKQTQDGSTIDGGIEDVTEVVRAGLQLAIEHQEDMITTMLPTPVDGSEPL